MRLIQEREEGTITKNVRLSNITNSSDARIRYAELNSLFLNPFGNLERLRSVLSVAKKSSFLAIFLLTLFVFTLKYPYVCQMANINRQKAKMTFQFACRKWLSHKDLEPASPVN